MTDGRRHSVDIPISRTLVALRRVRSLRDPSTNSMSKFSALLDNVNWETNSGNAISMRFMNGLQGEDSYHNGVLSNGLGSYRQGEDKVDDLGMHFASRKSKLITCDNSGSLENPVTHWEALDNYGSNQEEVKRKKSLSERYCSNHRDKGLDLTCMLPTSNCLEDVDSCNEQTVESQLDRIHHSVSKRKSQCNNQAKSSGAVGDGLSCAGSPCPTMSDALSSHSMPLFASEEVDPADHNHRGCGISCCWSRTPRFRRSNPSFEMEDHPLLLKDAGESALYGHRSWKHVNDDINVYAETPRSLSQKFRPKSFDELVGQNIVVRSLLGAISRGQINSFYLFHGPRGTGKTSASRIFAAALNCLTVEEPKPCGMCHECAMFFSGRSRDVKEVDSVRINRTERVRLLLKNAVSPPILSRFKVFIIDECHLLSGETWATVLNGVENLSQHVVFVMITPDLDKLPRIAVTRSQRFHFPKIKDADIASRLANLCVEEGLDFDQTALNFIAAKSNGSMRDAEMMLDQLSLLGKEITLSLAYELIGIVSDDELFDLLDLALSSDTSKTVIRARELMRSRIDPMQLISQLANLIMDILADKCQEDSSEARRKFVRKHTSEVDKQKLSHALKVLSESEKQLRMSKNQTTWLTVALLQLTSVETASLDANDSMSSLRNGHDREGEFCSTPSGEERLKHFVPCPCDDNNSHRLGIPQDCDGTLESLWKKATELCQSNSLKNFLWKQGKLSSLFVDQGLAVAELEFHQANHVSRAEKSWKLIASSLQLILGCNVEIRIHLEPGALLSKRTKVRKLSFSLFSCSRRRQQKSVSTIERGSDSNYSDYTSDKPMIMDRPILTCSSYCGPIMQHNCPHRMEKVRALRNREGNVLSVGTASSHRSVHEDTSATPGCGVDSSKEGSNYDYSVLPMQEPENQPNCFPQSLRVQKKLPSSDAEGVSMSGQQQNKLALSIPRKTSFETHICASGPDDFCGNSSNINSFRDEDGLMENTDVLCWRTPTFPSSKLTHQRRKLSLAGWVLPCAAAK